MNRAITVYRVDFESGSVTVQSGKGNALVTLTADNTIIEHAGYHVHISGGGYSDC